MKPPYDPATLQAAIDKLIAERETITDDDTVREMDGVLCEGIHLAQFLESPDVSDLPEFEGAYDSLQVANVYLLRATDGACAWSVLISEGQGQAEDVVGGGAPFFTLTDLAEYLSETSRYWPGWDFRKVTASAEMDELYEELIGYVGEHHYPFFWPDSQE